jgi:hypothetical protein
MLSINAILTANRQVGEAAQPQKNHPLPFRSRGDFTSVATGASQAPLAYDWQFIANRLI